ncbi:hypothetical protein PFISCL1PPCAC_17156, partial [Pristionchus fissidentatus]
EKFNEGKMKVDNSKTGLAHSKVYVRKGQRDFSNVRFLLEARTSWIRSPIATIKIMERLMEERISVADAFKKITKTDKPIFQQCRKKKNEAPKTNREIALAAFPGDSKADEKLIKYIQILKDQKYQLWSHHVCALVKKLKEMDSYITTETIQAIDNLPILPDLVIIEGDE